MLLSRKMLSFALVLALVGPVVAAPSAALGQSAGDDQYVDPFQNEGGSGGDGGNSGSQGESGGGDGAGGDTSGSTETPTDTAEPGDPATSGTTTSDSGSTAGTSAGGESLPNTGLPIGVLVAAGLLLLGGGLTLRRRA